MKRITTSSVLAIILFFICLSFNAQDNKTIIQDYLSGISESEGLKSSDVSDFIITDQYSSESTGIVHVYVRQLIDGIEVINGNANFNIINGEVFSWGNGFIADISSKANGTNPKISESEAIIHAAEGLNIKLTNPPILLEKKADNSYLFDKSGIALDDI